MSDWVIIYKSNNSNLTQMVQSLLEENNINVVTINKMDSVNLHLTNAAFIELHVKPDDLLKARHLIAKNSF